MLKQACKLLIVPLALLAFASPTWANGLGVILDPPSTPVVLPTGSFYDITPGNFLFLVTWGSCSQPGMPSAFSGDAGCMILANDSGGPITSLSLIFTVNGALDGLDLSCTNPLGDPHLSSNTCSDLSGPLVSGDTVDVTFFGGTPIPGSTPLNTSFFYIAETGVPYTSLPMFGVSVPTYDPSTLVLLATGMAFLAMGAFRRAA